MARIWYSVLGDGMGHAVRSHSVIQHLKGRHELMITASGKAYPFLKAKYGSMVHEIAGTEFIYAHNKVQMGRTVRKYLKELPKYFGRNYVRISRLLLDFRPDLVISDFESAAHYFAMALGIPCISVDNIHILTECKMAIPEDGSYSMRSVKAFIKFLHPASDYYVITAFADAKPKRRNAFLVPPIVRDEVRRLKPETGDHVLVYQTSATNSAMLRVLRKSGSKFYVYGMGEGKSKGNIRFRKFGEKRFLEDLRTSRYVIINGGFTVLSEALFLKKPVLALPIEKQYEQEFNAYSIRQKGYGDYAKHLTTNDLLMFEQRLNYYRKNLNNINTRGNEDAYRAVDACIKRCLRMKKPKYSILEKMVKSES